MNKAVATMTAVRRMRLSLVTGSNSAGATLSIR
jgi:hypothetical protein